MIVEYHRPDTIQEALKLLSRKDPITIPLGGGTQLSASTQGPVAVVDLQMLGLNIIQQKGNNLEIGSTACLQDLLKNKKIPPGLKSAVKHESTYNLRQIATVAGTLLSADGRSPFATAMLALDAQFVFSPGENVESIGNYFPMRDGRKEQRLIVKLIIPFMVELAYLYVARTPADFPIVCTAVVRWSSGRTRVAVGGYGKFPKLAMDSPNANGAEIAAHNVYLEAGDQWASGVYRSDVAKTLTKRCINQIATEN